MPHALVRRDLRYFDMQDTTRSRFIPQVHAAARWVWDLILNDDDYTPLRPSSSSSAVIPDAPLRHSEAQIIDVAGLSTQRWWGH